MILLIEVDDPFTLERAPLNQEFGDSSTSIFFNRQVLMEEKADRASILNIEVGGVFFPMKKKKKKVGILLHMSPPLSSVDDLHPSIKKRDKEEIETR